LTHTHCNQELWTSARFAETVIDSSNHAIDLLKQQFGASSLRLIGYSGGGAIAALVAARRSDVIQLVTVAGNLDHEAWTRHHSISPLHRSLNPADAWHALARIPQVHFIGENDRNIGPFVIDAYLERFPDGQRPPVHLVKDADHYCCWMEHWPALLRIIHAGPGHD
jgi:dienelactone hydrolase